MKSFLKSKWIVSIAVILGVLILKNAISNRQQVTKKEVSKLQISARAIQVKKATITPIIDSYGEAKSARIWKVLSELSGRVSYIHPELKSGFILEKGEVLFELDTSTLDLKKQEYDAQIKVMQSNIDQKEVEKKNIQSNLHLENEQLKIDEKELLRIKKLVEGKTSTESILDSQNRSYLNRKQKIQSLLNNLNLYPSQLANLMAQLKVQKYRYSQVLEDIKKGRVVLPFTARLGKVELYKDSYVTAYHPLFEAHDVSKSEVHLQLSVEEIKSMLSIDERQLQFKPGSKKFFESLKVKAAISSTSNKSFQWNGKVTRFKESLDPASRTIGLVVEVDKPYDPKLIGIRPPLLHGMYVHVKLTTENRKSGFLIPRDALHVNEILTLSKDNLLTRQKVENFLMQKDWVLLTDLNEDQLVIVSDVKLGLEGIKVQHKLDISLQEKLNRRVMEN